MRRKMIAGVPTQLTRVFNVVKDGRWHSLASIARCINAPIQSVSARLRDLRKQRYGSHVVDTKGSAHYDSVWYYRLVK